jgi:hypothetical protein
VWLGGVSILSVIITGRLEQALGIESFGHDRNMLAVSIVILTVLFSAISFIILFFIRFFFLINFYHLYRCLCFLFLCQQPFFLAVSQIWQSLSACDGRFRELSIIRIVQASSITIAQILIGIFKPSAISLSFSMPRGPFSAPLPAFIFCLHLAFLFWRQRYF